MLDLKGGVAVVTGGASGIGRALAERLAREGMRLVLADVEAEPLEKTAAELAPCCEGLETALLDVRDADSMEKLAARVDSRFGAPRVLCNNAGVAAGGLSWEISAQDWDWVVGVNLIGVVNGIRAFVPRMIAAGQPAHVVNTASVAGLTAPAFMSPYNATKHAVVALSETLKSDLQVAQAQIGVSVLCPGWVRTRIHEADRNKPGAGGEAAAEGDDQVLRDLVGGFIANGMLAEDVAEAVVEAIGADRFWIRTHAEMEPNVRDRAQAVIDASPPPFMPPTEIK